MARPYNVIDADGHILEPVDLWDEVHGPRLSRPRASPHRRHRRQGAPARRGPGAGQPEGPRRRRGHRRPATGRCRRHDEVHRGPPGRLRSPRAHPRHGPRRHRRGVPLPEHRPVRRRHQGSRAGRRGVPGLQPLAGRLLPAVSRPPLRRGHAAHAVDRPAIEEMRYARRELGMRGGFLRPNPYNGRMLHHPDYDAVLDRGAGTRLRHRLHEGAAAACPRSASTASRRVGRGTSSRTRWR